MNMILEFVVRHFLDRCEVINPDNVTREEMVSNIVLELEGEIRGFLENRGN